MAHLWGGYPRPSAYTDVAGTKPVVLLDCLAKPLHELVGRNPTIDYSTIHADLDR